jgi:superfamily I DNA/RNA helicase
MMKRTLILGGPGAGKTTSLVKIVERALARGVPPERIAFVTFTKAAALEARDRAAKALGLDAEELVNFRTIHSLAFRQLGLKRSDVLGEDHLAELSEITGELFTGSDPFASSEGPAAGRNADPLLTLDHYARTTMRSLREAWEDHGGQVEWFRLKRFTDAYRYFKSDRCVLDFTDMLSDYIEKELPPMDVEEAIVDEAQDLTLLQWHVVMRAFSSAGSIYAAGDDDQSIHRWAGAAEDHLLTLGWPIEHLPTSHRLPKKVFLLAQDVIRRVGRRYEKPTKPSERDGSVDWVSGPGDLDLSSGSWLLLARTRAQLHPLAQAARDQGAIYAVKGKPSVDMDHVRAIVAHEALRAGKRVDGPEAGAALAAAGSDRDVNDARSYTADELGYDARPIWHDALIKIPLDVREYYLSCMRRGQDLRRPPTVRVETIHGAKGAEAERVVLATDLTYRTHRGYELDPDSENRVFYVGMTRASQGLYLVAPETAYGFPVP